MRRIPGISSSDRPRRHAPPGAAVRFYTGCQKNEARPNTESAAATKKTISQLRSFPATPGAVRQHRAEKSTVLQHSPLDDVLDSKADEQDQATNQMLPIEDAVEPADSGKRFGQGKKQSPLVSHISPDGGVLNERHLPTVFDLHQKKQSQAGAQFLLAPRRRRDALLTIVLSNDTASRRMRSIRSLCKCSKTPAETP